MSYPGLVFDGDDPESDGNTAIILDGPVDADGYTWFQVAGEGFSGWAIETYMRLPEAIAQLYATATPTPE